MGNRVYTESNTNGYFISVNFLYIFYDLCQFGLLVEPYLSREEVRISSFIRSNIFILHSLFCNWFVVELGDDFLQFSSFDYKYACREFRLSFFVVLL